MATIEALLHRRTDLSTFLVHLTRAGTNSALENLKSIVETSTVEARSPFGPAANLQEHLEGSVATQKAVCLTETPLEHVWMMLEEIEGRKIQFAPYGLAITKTTGRRAAFNPVWYSDITPGHDWPMRFVNEMVDGAIARATSATGEVDGDALSREPILRIAPFIEQMGPTTDGRKEFWWEREWRKVGDYYIPSASNVVALLAPEGEHGDLEGFLRDVDERQRTRWTERPILDPHWGLERMIAALARVPEELVGPFPGR